MLSPDEVDEIAKRTMQDLADMPRDVYFRMLIEVERQRLAGEDADYEKILKAGRAEQ